MTDRFFIPQPIPSTIQPAPKIGQQSKTAVQGGTSFQHILQEHLQGKDALKFSQHAQHRLQVRQINLNNSDLERINRAVDKAAQKGAKESLVLMDNLAFVISIKNRTVITALDGAQLKENVFTNIDSAVII